MGQYTARKFINELLEELNEHPEGMYIFNPYRVSREHTGCTLQDISKIWGHYDGYISEKLNYHKNNPNFILPEKNLNEIRQNLKKWFGQNANGCLRLIDSHSNGQLSFNTLIYNLKIELGKISLSVKTTLEELALIFGYGYGMIGYIRQHDDFILSRERINLIKNNLKQILGSFAEKSLKISNKYIERNPDLPDYANQNYTITNPNLFQDIYTNDAMYWLGWLCSDGWLSKPGNTHYQIQLKIKREDRVILERFANAVGYDQERIFDETYLLKKDRKIRKIKSSRVIFGCKPMWHDLEQLGIFDFKNSGKVPRIIKQLIKIVRSKDDQLISSEEEQLVLNFLIGFYDGDGSYSGGMTARIINSKKDFLEEIKALYMIQNKVNTNAEEVVDNVTGKIVWKRRYQLYIGPELFKQMLLSFEDSLQRKRPDMYKNS
jgi:hypothetical protein